MLHSQQQQDTQMIIEPCNSDCSFCFLNYTDVLERNLLFKGLNKSEIGFIINKVHHQVRTVEKNGIIAMEGDMLRHLIIVVEGSVVGEMMDFDGNILRVETIEASKSLATAFIFGEKNRFPVTVIALESTRLLLIEKDELLSLFSENKIVMRNFLDMISDRAQFLSRRIKMLTLPDLKAKVAFYLLEQMKRSGNSQFRIPNTQQELSEILGSTRPSVGRIFRELHNENYIHARGKEIKVLDTAGLSSLLSG